MKNKIKHIFCTGSLLCAILFGVAYTSVYDTGTLCSDQKNNQCHWKDLFELPVATALAIRGTDSEPRVALSCQTGRNDACCKGNEWKFEIQRAHLQLFLVAFKA